MDEDFPPEQDPSARLKALSAGGSSRLAKLQLVPQGPAGPITPGHSKFTPAELSARADAAVDQATDETLESQADLIRTTQAGAGAALAVPEAVSLVRSIPAMLKSAPSVGRVVGAIKNFVGRKGTAPVVEPPSAPRTLFDGPKRLTPEPVTQVRTQSPIGSAMERGPVEEEFVKGYPISSDPPSNPVLMRELEEGLLRMKPKATTPLSRVRGEPAPPFRPTGGQSSRPSVADVLRARRQP